MSGISEFVISTGLSKRTSAKYTINMYHTLFEKCVPIIKDTKNYIHEKNQKNQKNQNYFFIHSVYEICYVITQHKSIFSVRNVVPNDFFLKYFSKIHHINPYNPCVNLIHLYNLYNRNFH